MTLKAPRRENARDQPQIRQRIVAVHRFAEIEFAPQSRLATANIKLAVDRWVSFKAIRFKLRSKRQPRLRMSPAGRIFERRVGASAGQVSQKRVRHDHVLPRCNGAHKRNSASTCSLL